MLEVGFLMVLCAVTLAGSLALCHFKQKTKPHASHASYMSQLQHASCEAPRVAEWRAADFRGRIDAVGGHWHSGATVFPVEISLNFFVDCRSKWTGATVGR